MTGLTGKTVLLPSGDVDAYRKHIQNFIGHFKPVGHAESYLVQALADHDWRLDRIASLEMAIYAYGHEQFAEQFADRAELQIGFTEMHTFLHYEKQLRNLQIQEMRIRRSREKDIAELRRLQQERSRAEAQKELEQQKNVLARRSFARRSRPGRTVTADDDKRPVGFEFGAISGLAAALALIRLMKSLLFQVSPADPLTYIAASAFLVLAAILGSYLPARRATRIDPVEARAE